MEFVVTNSSYFQKIRIYVHLSFLKLIKKPNCITIFLNLCSHHLNDWNSDPFPRVRDNSDSMLIESCESYEIPVLL